MARSIAGIVWGPPMLILLVGTHVYLTFRLRFIQRYIGKAIRISLKRESEGEGDVSQFGALTTALAATIGTGNIVGVATAVASGGPGAVLWMWLTGVFGIATKYAEALLSVKYRDHHARRHDGRRADVRARARHAEPSARDRLRRAHRGERLRHRQHRAGQLDRDACARHPRRLDVDLGRRS